MILHIGSASEHLPCLQNDDEDEVLCQCCKQNPVFHDKDYCAACWVDIDFPDPSGDIF